MSSQNEQELMFSKIIINLLKGVIYRENDLILWGKLLDLKNRIIDYTKVMGLTLYINEIDGHAFLKNISLIDEDNDIPKLISKRQLSLRVSALLILLRKRMIELDSEEGPTVLILKRTELLDMMRIYIKEANNQVLFEKNSDSVIAELIDFGFLLKIKGRDNEFEVLRIIKDFISSDFMAEMDAKLTSYQNSVAGESAGQENLEGI